MDNVNFVLVLYGQCGFCFRTVWTVWILKLYEQCGFWNCMDSGFCFVTVWTVWILFWNCMDSVDFVLELYGQCVFCFRTAWTV